MIAGLLAAPLATAASAGAATSTGVVAGHPAAPTENPYCDYRSGYLCESYGYPPDYVPGGYGNYPHHHRHWHHWRHQY